MKQKNVLV